MHSWSRRRCRPGLLHIFLLLSAFVFSFHILSEFAHRWTFTGDDGADGGVYPFHRASSSSSFSSSIYDATTAPIAASNNDDADLATLIPGSYIVVLKPGFGGLDAHFRRLQVRLEEMPDGGIPDDMGVEVFEIPGHNGSAEPKDTKNSERAKDAKAFGFVAYTGDLPSPVYTALESLPDVAFIEPDRYFSLPERRKHGRVRPEMVRSREIVFGPSGPGMLEGSHSPPPVYVLSTGFHMTSAVFDAGVYAKHYWTPDSLSSSSLSSSEGPDSSVPVTPRVRLGYNAALDTSDLDSLRIGTGMVSIIASRLLGCTTSSNVTAVKIFDDSGRASISGLLSALTWAVGDAHRNGNLQQVVIALGAGGDGEEGWGDIVEEGEGGDGSAAVEMALRAVQSGGVVVVRPGGRSGVGVGNGIQLPTFDSSAAKNQNLADVENGEEETEKMAARHPKSEKPVGIRVGVFYGSDVPAKPSSPSTMLSTWPRFFSLLFIPFRRTSSRGTGYGGIDILAPGSAVVVSHNGEIEVVDGVEAAVAWVAGVVARVREENPNWSPEEVRQGVVVNARRRGGLVGG